MNGYQTIDWVDLIPKDDLDALNNPPDSLLIIEEGSVDDIINDQPAKKPQTPEEKRYQEALSSTKIKSEFNEKKIRIPGFIVPLQYDNNQATTEFFLVPYFGACIHMPPPPPNQIIFVSYTKGLKLDDLYTPFWIEGTLKTELTDKEIGTSAYSLTADKLYEYKE